MQRARSHQLRAIIAQRRIGARRLRQWLLYPLRSVDALLARQQCIADLLDAPDGLRALRVVLEEMGYED